MSHTDRVLDAICNKMDRLIENQKQIERFRQESGAHLTIMEGGEHWFHTPVQMAVLQTWEETNF